MGFIKYASDVTAPITVAFAYADDPLSIPNWMAGAAEITRCGDPEGGIGAKYEIGYRLGPWHPVLHCEVTEHRQDAVLGYALTGPFTARLTLRFDPLGRGRSVLTSELDFPASTGFAAALRERPRAALLRRALRRSESRLRRAIEEFHGTDLVGRLA
ncbi:SRPBCC family protein [Nocardia testacea]|uniref:SRPBCC family protein n=1 Tax=Nocardia testacea TaxID=248551 RepID=A0ABW7W337_9NOCA|nr:SRPBCC family protein [Nocardia testacea]